MRQAQPPCAQKQSSTEDAGVTQTDMSHMLAETHDVGGGRDGVQPSVQTDQGSGEEELPDDSRRQQDANLLSAHSVSKLIGLLRQGTSRLKRGSPTNSST